MQAFAQSRQETKEMLQEMLKNFVAPPGPPAPQPPTQQTSARRSPATKGTLTNVAAATVLEELAKKHVVRASALKSRLGLVHIALTHYAVGREESEYVPCTEHGEPHKNLPRRSQLKSKQVQREAFPSGTCFFSAHWWCVTCMLELAPKVSVNVCTHTSKLAVQLGPVPEAAKAALLGGHSIERTASLKEHDAQYGVVTAAELRSSFGSIWDQVSPEQQMPTGVVQSFVGKGFTGKMRHHIMTIPGNLLSADVSVKCHYVKTRRQMTADGKKTNDFALRHVTLRLASEIDESARLAAKAFFDLLCKSKSSHANKSHQQLHEQAPSTPPAKAFSGAAAPQTPQVAYPSVLENTTPATVPKKIVPQAVADLEPSPLPVASLQRSSHQGSTEQVILAAGGAASFTITPGVITNPQLEAKPKRSADQPEAAAPAPKKAKSTKGVQLPNGVTSVNLAPSDTFCKIFTSEDVQQQQRVLMAVVWNPPTSKCAKSGQCSCFTGPLALATDRCELFKLVALPQSSSASKDGWRVKNIECPSYKVPPTLPFPRLCSH
jgi:hypothetical protein